MVWALVGAISLRGESVLRYMTAGESHGPALVGILDGMPAGVTILQEDIDRDLARRQMGYGRGGRMKIERDKAEILSGLRFKKSLGSPIALLIRNQDHANWGEVMAPQGEAIGQPMTRPRPGHADLTGALKFDHKDVRNVLERASARETTTRVALGALAKALLRTFDVSIGSYVVELGGIRVTDLQGTLAERSARAEESQVRSPDAAVEARIMEAIDEAKKQGDSLGGQYEVWVEGLPVGLGTYTQWDGRLDGRLAQALMSIQAMKAVDIGIGSEAAHVRGSKVHDEIFYSKEQGYYRKTNRAGGLEGGMTNGEPLLVRVTMKPISTLYNPLQSVDMRNKEPYEAKVERSDITAVPAAAVVGEAMVALTIADAFLAKFGGDSVSEIGRNLQSYREAIKE